MATTWWKTSADGQTWTIMPAPASLSYSINEIEGSSFRSVVTGVLTRSRVRSNIGEWSLKFNAIDAVTLSTILTATSAVTFYIQIYQGGALSGNKHVYAEAPSISLVQRVGSPLYNLSLKLVEC